MNLTREQVKELCEGFDAMRLINEVSTLHSIKEGTVGGLAAAYAVRLAYALGRQRQAQEQALQTLADQAQELDMGYEDK